jgi:TPR repeat protein
VTGCAAGLLAEAGAGEAAAGFLRQRAGELPEDVGELRNVAGTAQQAGQLDVAEQAMRRILEVDPRSESGWTHLGVFLEKQERLEDLERLLERARRELPAPPVDLLRAVGRARVAAADALGGLEALQEARAALPPGSEPGWLDHELRNAYAAFGRQQRAPAPRPAPAARTAAAPPSSGPASPTAPSSGSGEVEPAGDPSAAGAAGGTPEELLAAAEALHSGSGGRYDPPAALVLFERAAATGDPRASYRLALLRHLSRSGRPEDRAEAAALHRRAASAVQALAAQGDAYAQYLVGTGALVGVGGREDPVAARRWLEPAAARGQSWAWHNLGWMRETGKGFGEGEEAAAVEAYRKASELGNAVSMLDYAGEVLTDNGSGQPCADGLRWLERSARTGHPGAAAFLGKLLLYGRGRCVAAAPERALEWLEAGAAAGAAGTDCDLGVALLTGAAGERDAARALGWLEQAAARPDRFAAETLAFAFATGAAPGVERDPDRARHLLAEAARIGSDGFPELATASRKSRVVEQLFLRGVERLEGLAGDGDAAAAGLLSTLHANGMGVPWDWERAVRLARPAAQAGDPTAMRILAYAYQHGNGGLGKDTGEALRWWRRGAEDGNSFSMMFYGIILMKGELVDRDLETGARWLHRAAEAGNWWAIGDLGRLYDEAWYGLPRDPDQAASWKRIRARGGDAEARGWLVAHGYPVE